MKHAEMTCGTGDIRPVEPQPALIRQNDGAPFACVLSFVCRCVCHVVPFAPLPRLGAGRGRERKPLPAQGSYSPRLHMGKISAEGKGGAAVLCLSLLQLFQTSPRGGAFTSFHLFTSRMKVLEIRSSLWIFGSLHRSDGIPRRSRPDWGPRGWGSAPRGERPLSARAGRRRESRAQSERSARHAGADGAGNPGRPKFPSCPNNARRAVNHQGARARRMGLPHPIG